MASQISNSGSVKVIGANGQISLGKQFAGRQVLVEEREPGVWLIRTAKVVPDNEAWLLNNPKAMADLEASMEWALANPPDDSNTEELLKRWGAEFAE